MLVIGFGLAVSEKGWGRKKIFFFFLEHPPPLDLLFVYMVVKKFLLVFQLDK